MAIVDIDGERQLADLGPISTYKVELQPSTRIIIQGVPVRVQNHRVIMAEQIRLGDEVIRIQRSRSKLIVGNPIGLPDNYFGFQATARSQTRSRLARTASPPGRNVSLGLVSSM